MATKLLVTLLLCLSVQLVFCQFGLFNQQGDRGNGILSTPRRIAESITGFFNNGRRHNRPSITTDVDQGNYNLSPNTNEGAIVFPTESPNERPQDNYGYVNPDNGPNKNDNQNNQEYISDNNNENNNQMGAVEATGNSGNNLQNNQNQYETTSSSVDTHQNTGGFSNGESTTLPALTPVPSFESRNNANFGSAGIFQDTCETVEGNTGSCISILQCEPYLGLVKQSRMNPGLVVLLRKAHCGFEGSNPKVCCPLAEFPSVPEDTTTTTTTTSTTTTTPSTTTTTIAPTSTPTSAVKTVNAENYVAELPAPPVCGTSNATFSRVVGGVDAKLGDFPWMALLGYMDARNPNTRWLCGGSIITSKHILTAAHCIHNRNDLYLVRVGELDLAREDDGATPVDVLIKEKTKHPQYSPTSYTNDIGILLLQNELVFSDLIKPICMPQDTELRSRSFEDYNPLIAGWGHTEFRGASATHLQVLQLPVVSNDACAKVYAPYKAQVIDQRVLCAGYEHGGKDACQGDSGGPLMQPIWNNKSFKTYFYQIGVVSYGKKCAEAGFPGVYTRVTNFVPWIEEQVLGYTR